jgi:hypothetical protein
MEFENCTKKHINPTKYIIEERINNPREKLLIYLKLSFDSLALVKDTAIARHNEIIKDDIRQNIPRIPNVRNFVCKVPFNSSELGSPLLLLKKSL